MSDQKYKESRFERMVLGQYTEVDRLKELQNKAKDKGLWGDEVYEFIHLDRKELSDKNESLKEQIKDYEEALKEIRESYYPGGADLISDIATEVLEKWRKGNG